jgi:hypothetical protein
MENWTEGPWEVQTYQEPFDAGKTYYQVTTIPEQILVAKCGVGEFEIPGNAHLIAAAPDLYNALETLAQAWESKGLPCDAARAALAKARGE